MLRPCSKRSQGCRGHHSSRRQPGMLCPNGTWSGDRACWVPLGRLAACRWAPQPCPQWCRLQLAVRAVISVRPTVTANGGPAARSCCPDRPISIARARRCGAVGTTARARRATPTVRLSVAARAATPGASGDQSQENLTPVQGGRTSGATPFSAPPGVARAPAPSGARIAQPALVDGFRQATPGGPAGAFAACATSTTPPAKARHSWPTSRSVGADRARARQAPRPTRPGTHRPRALRLVGAIRGAATIHPARQSGSKRVHEELHRPLSGRMLEPELARAPRRACR
jgi:hypothetical protein